MGILGSTRSSTRPAPIHIPTQLRPDNPNISQAFGDACRCYRAESQLTADHTPHIECLPTCRNVVDSCHNMCIAGSMSQCLHMSAHRQSGLPPCLRGFWQERQFDRFSIAQDYASRSLDLLAACRAFHVSCALPDTVDDNFYLKPAQTHRSPIFLILGARITEYTSLNPDAYKQTCSRTTSYLSVTGSAWRHGSSKLADQSRFLAAANGFNPLS